MSSLPIDPNPAHTPLRLQSEQPAPSNPGLANPLSDAHLNRIRLASKRAKPVEKAIRYANFSGWTTLLAGALSLPFALGNLPMMIFALVIAGVGTRELTLRRQLIKLDMRVPTKLAINQLMLGGALITYAVYMLVATPSKTMIESAMEADPVMQSTPELAGMMDELIQLEQVATAMMYLAMIALAMLFQGGTALYYFLKGSKLKRLHKETPEWVINVYKAVHHS